METRVLETERLILRRLTPDDLEALHRIFSDSSTMSFWAAPFTEDDTRRWILRALRYYETLGFGRWAVVLKETGELIGDCGILRTEVDGKMEHDLGYVIHHPCWGSGYATEAAEACKHYAIETFGIRRLVANMPVEHTASARVAEKIGMTLEKTFDNPKNRGIETRLYSLSV